MNKTQKHKELHPLKKVPNKRMNRETPSGIEYFILIALFFSEAFLQAYEVVSQNNNQNLLSSKEGKEEEKMRKELVLKSIDELQNILAEKDIITAISKDKLIEVILSDPEAIKNELTAEHKKQLNKMTKEEIRVLLNGEKAILKLKKSELIKMAVANYESKFD